MPSPIASELAGIAYVSPWPDMYQRPHRFDPEYDDDPEPCDDDSDAINAESFSPEERNPSLLNL